MDADEKASFAYGGQRARPRKGIERSLLNGVTYLKPPGSCRTKYPDLGINVEVECLEKSSVYVLDVCEQVQVSDLVGCRVVIGPCVGSAMIFDCVDCTIAVAAKQTRLRDCKNCELRTFSPTLESVVIETSQSLKFGCWDVAYAGLAAQMRAAKWLQVDATNYWDKIFDFSPADKGATPNWSKLPGADPAGKWCQLTIKPEGYREGSVVESRSDEPSVEGCECPITAQDGSKFTAAWYSAAEDLASAVTAAAEAKAAAAPATTIADISLDTAPKPGLFKRLFGWLFGKKSSEKYAVAEPAASKGPSSGKETQVCGLQ